MRWTDSLSHQNRFIELADNVVDHLIASMSSAVAGFSEVYNSSWGVDSGVTSMDIGHGFKTAWVLQRAYLLHPDHPQYLSSAQAHMQNLWEHGCYDSIHGAPYRYVNSPMPTLIPIPGGSICLQALVANSRSHSVLHLQ
jgi:hypothetical protein